MHHITPTGAGAGGTGAVSHDTGPDHPRGRGGRGMGTMLAATQRARGGQPHQRGRKPTSNQRVPVEPTLKEIGVTKKESVEAQMLAGYPGGSA